MADIDPIEFNGWPKTPRLSAGGVTITEKIDGTNACVIIREVDTVQAWGRYAPDYGGVCWVAQSRPESEGGGQRTFLVGAQSRKRLLKITEDNAGFARYVYDNREALVDLLGPGTHFGEWWGQGIQRRYGMDRKVFSLFNTHRWHNVANQRTDWWDEAAKVNLDVVPLLSLGRFSDKAIDDALDLLRREGSIATIKYGIHFDRPEGVIIRHSSLGGNLKAFVENDDVPKSVSGD